MMTMVHQPGRSVASRRYIGNYPKKEFVFYAPVRPVSRVTISADVSPFAIASPGDTLLFYQAEELRDRVFTPASATFVYESRNNENEFAIRQDGTANSGISPAVTAIKFSDRGKHLLLFPLNPVVHRTATVGSISK